MIERPDLPAVPNRPVVAAVVAIGLLVTACGGDKAPSKDQLTDALVTSGLPRSQSRCAANKIFSELNAGERRKLASEGSGALQQKAATTLGQALAACR
jgi:hypothetical protein